MSSQWMKTVKPSYHYQGHTPFRLRQQKSKAIEMRIYWEKDRVKQGQFKIYWEPGRNNKADYFTKHHPLDHHIKVRHEYLNIALTLINNTLRGCVNLSPVSEGGNPDIENRDHGQSTMYSSATPLAIEQVRRSLRLLEPMTKRENRFPS